MPLIEFEGVSKIYSRQSREFVWRFLLEALGGKKGAPHYALRDVTLRVEGGAAVGVVGHNGAGKSTLLNLVAGLTVPEEGTVRVEGRVCAMMELGSGFHPDLTAAENVRINAALLGMTRQQVEERFERIVEFAGMREFIGEPLRTFSQGMVLRLAFSVVAHAEPDILLIDEVLVVGDQDFQEKCYAFFREMKQAGKILLCVSHAPEVLSRICDEGIWLERGELKMRGALEEVLERYSGKGRQAKAEVRS
jgi:ABC-type polysaccharide/polyol phosphate transport system ATPase subunit